MKAIFLLFALAFSYGVADESVIHPSLLKEIKAGKTKNVFVTMKGGNAQVIDDINSRSFASREDKITALMEGSRANAAMSQADVLNYIRGTPLSFDSLPLSNEIYVRDAGPLAIMAMAAFPNVASVREEAIIPISAPVVSEAKFFFDCPKRDIEWGVEAIKAPNAWNAGYNGTNVVVAVIDTGVNRKHKDLKDNYRGGPYSWLDPVYFTRRPNDLNSHGTHVAGTAVGRNGVGVAPGATWIACRGCGLFNCQEFHLKACGQWVTCPSNMTSQNKCKDTPHVVNNSWGGGSGDTWYNEIITAWKAAGIIPVFAAGNSGDKCETLGSPGDQDNLIGVAATNKTRHVAKFSSRGPPKDFKDNGGPNNLNKPDVAAPGEDICSSSFIFNNARIKMSGTSMAAPHVAGAVALVAQALGDIDLPDIYEKIIQILKQTTTKSVSTGESCGNSTRAKRDSDNPNYQVGTGIIDCFAAVNAAKGPAP